MDIEKISSELTLTKDGIWQHYKKKETPVFYPMDSHDIYAGVEDHSFWFRHRNNCIISLIKRYHPNHFTPIFDIGGGNGYVALGLIKAGFNVTVVEPQYTGALNAKRRGINNVICATIETAKFIQKSLPAVCLFDVIEHIHENDVTFLTSVKSVMQNEGLLYVTVPAFNLLWSNEDIIDGHFKRYSLKSITQTIESAGFHVLFSSYFFRFLPLPIFLLRTIPYKLGLKTCSQEISDKKVQRDNVFKRKLTTYLIETLCQQELAKLQNKKKIHFGSSCLIVAKNNS